MSQPSHENGPRPGGQELLPARSGGISRRRALGLMGGAGAVAGIVGFGGGWLLRDSEPPPLPEVRYRPLARFTSLEATNVAEGLNLSPDTYLLGNPELPDYRRVTDAISATPENVLTTNLVPPVLVPGSGRHVRWVNQILADEPAATMQPDGSSLHLPPLIPLVVNTLETGGKLTSVSPKRAIGPMQVVPEEHLDKLLFAAESVDRPLGISREELTTWKRLVNKGDKDGATAFMHSLGKQGEITSALQDPYVGFLTGIMVLNEYRGRALKKIKETKPDIDPNHLDVWKLALGVYNGGTIRLDQNFDQWPDQTKMYVLNALRFLMTAEVAHQIQNPQANGDPGLGVVSAAQGVKSKELDARVYAFTKVRKNWPDKLGMVFQALNARDFESSDPRLTEDLRRFYEDYVAGILTGHDHFQVPLSAGARAWVGPGDGETLLREVEDNLKPGKYATNW